MGTSSGKARGDREHVRVITKQETPPMRHPLNTHTNTEDDIQEPYENTPGTDTIPAAVLPEYSSKGDYFLPLEKCHMIINRTINFIIINSTIERKQGSKADQRA